MKSYVAYNAAGDLTGAYLQELLAEHADCYIEVPSEQRLEWLLYRTNEARDGLELLPLPSTDLGALRIAKNADIDRWRAEANASTFPHQGKLIACDALSRSDIDGVANHIALFGAFPEGFPGGWKATDKTMLPLPDVDAFRAMYASMTAQGAENFNHSQALKAQLATASTPEEIAAIHW